MHRLSASEPQPRLCGGRLFPGRLLRLCVAGLALAVGGCALGPDFHAPKMPADDAIAGTGALAPTASAPGAGGVEQTFAAGAEIHADWYRLFRSDALDRLISLALKNSPTLQAASARLSASRHNLEAIKGRLYPQVDAGAAASRNRANGAVFGLTGPLFTNVFNLYQGQISLDYDLDVFGGLKRSIESGQAEVAFRRYQFLDAQVTLVHDVVATALAEAGVNAAIAATRKIAAAEHAQLELLRKMEDYGAVSQTDVLRAQTQLAATRATLPALVQQREVAQDRLAVLTGRDPGTFEAPVFDLDRLTLPHQVPVSLPSQLVRRRPDIMAAQSLLHAASAQVGVAIAERFPDFRLNAGYGLQAPTVGNLVDPASAIWDFGLSLMAPLFHGGALKAKEKAARDLYKAAAADYRQTVLAAFGEVADALRALANDADALKAQEAARQSARQERDLVQKQLRAGAADYLELYTAQQQYEHAVLQTVSVRLKRYQDTAALFRALGGGWWNAAAPGVTAQINTHQGNGTSHGGRG